METQKLNKRKIKDLANESLNNIIHFKKKKDGQRYYYYNDNEKQKIFITKEDRKRISQEKKKIRSENLTKREEKLPEDYINKKVIIARDGNRYFYWYPGPVFNRTYITKEKVDEIKRKAKELKQENKEQSEQKYTVHYTIWKEFIVMGDDFGKEIKVKTQFTKKDNPTKIYPSRSGTLVVQTNADYIKFLENYPNYYEHNYGHKNNKLIQYDELFNDHLYIPIIADEQDRDQIDKNKGDVIESIIQLLNNEIVVSNWGKNANNDNDNALATQFKLHLYYGKFISFDDIRRGTHKKMNIMKTKLHAETCNTINNKAINYKGKTLKKIIDTNQLNDEHKQNACVYTSLIKIYGSTIKINQKRMSYNNLYQFFHGKKYIENADLGLSIEQLKKFFETFNLHCTLLDGQNKIFYNMLLKMLNTLKISILKQSLQIIIFIHLQID